MPLIDYFTTFAQIVNFLVLVFLLRHFLYRPVIRTMDEREQRIASRLKEADQKVAEAMMEAESYAKMEQDISNRRSQMLSKVEEDVQAARREMMETARKEVEANRAEWFQALERQKEDMLSDMSRHVGDEVYSIAGRALCDLAGQDLEGRIVDAFLLRLRSPSEADMDAVREFLSDSGGQAVVKTAFDLPGPERQKIAEALRALAGRDVEIQFDLDEKLISGIELSTGSIRISWSIEGYLDDLKSDLSRALEDRIAAEKAA